MYASIADVYASVEYPYIYNIKKKKKASAYIAC